MRTEFALLYSFNIEGKLPHIVVTPIDIARFIHVMYEFKRCVNTFFCALCIWYFS